VLNEPEGPTVARKTEIVDRDAYEKAIVEQRQSEKHLESESVAYGAAFEKTRGIIGSLSRYERTIERSLFKALEELRQIQLARLGSGSLRRRVLDVETAQHSKHPTAPAERGQPQALDSMCDGQTKTFALLRRGKVPPQAAEETEAIVHPKAADTPVTFTQTQASNEGSISRGFPPELRSEAPTPSNPSAEIKASDIKPEVRVQPQTPNSSAAQAKIVTQPQAMALPRAGKLTDVIVHPNAADTQLTLTPTQASNEAWTSMQSRVLPPKPLSEAGIPSNPNGAANANVKPKVSDEIPHWSEYPVKANGEEVQR
jgi:hypothetical protein